MSKAKRPAKPNYWNTRNYLEDSVELAAWHRHGIKPNGQFNSAPFSWPKPVRRSHDKLELATGAKSLRNCQCRKKHEGEACPTIRKRAIKALKPLRISSKDCKRIADALSLLAHAERPKTDRSAD